MKSPDKAYKTVDEYIAQYPKDIQSILKEIRATVLKAAPHAVEGIAYGMPVYKLNNKPLVYFAAFSEHIGLYATPKGHEAFKKELAKYKQGKGSVQFPLTSTIPLSLITKMVKYNVKSLKEGK